MKWVLALIGTACIGGATAQEGGADVSAWDRVTDAAGHRYFPKGKEGSFERFLLAMREPSLMTKLPADVERVARFTLLRAFHAPLAVRVTWRKDGQVVARSVRLHRSLEFWNPGKIEHDEELPLMPAKLDSIVAAFTKAEFWKELNADESEILIRDGATWIFEMHNQSGYKEFDLISPDTWTSWDERLKRAGKRKTNLRDVTVYREAGIRMMSLAGLLPPEKELY